MKKTGGGIAIVGGGIQGLYTAYLAKRRWPQLEVALLERANISSGASGVAPGIQIAFGRSRDELALSDAGQLAWNRTFVRWNWRAGRTIPIYWITSDTDTLSRNSSEVLHPLAVDTTIPSPGGCLKTSMGQHVLRGKCSYDPVAAVSHRLRSDIVALGVRVHENTTIVQISRNEGNDCLTLHSSCGRTHTCCQVVVAAGPWIANSPLADLCREVRKIKIKKVVAFILQEVPSPGDSAVGLFDDYAFLLPIIEKRQWLFSFSSDNWNVSANTIPIIDDDDVEKASSILRRYHIPEHFDLASSPCFCDSYTVDGLPSVAHADDGLPVTFMLGAGGNGFRFAPPLAEQALQLTESNQNICGTSLRF